MPIPLFTFLPLITDLYQYTIQAEEVKKNASIYIRKVVYKIMDDYKKYFLL